MLPALKIPTPQEKLRRIRQAMRRFISPILVDSVLSKAMADRGQPSTGRMASADLEALVGFGSSSTPPFYRS